MGADSARVPQVLGSKQISLLPCVDYKSAIDSACCLLATPNDMRPAGSTPLRLNGAAQEFLTKIVGLSYSGDVRMGVAEDPQKVRITHCVLAALQHGTSIL